MSHDTFSAASGWFPFAASRPDAAVRLLVLPYAGGSAASYAQWAGCFPSDVEVCPIQLPGRQSRLLEPPYTELGPLLDALYDAVLAESDGRPFALFGHSMGALLSYRLTIEIEAEGGPGPALLAVSGWVGSEHRNSPEPVADLSEDVFLAKVVELGAMPPEVVQNPELRELVLPALRADFTLVDGYRDDATPVACPVVAYTGDSDPLLNGSAMAGWGKLAGDFRGVRRFPGGHFYLSDHAAAVATDLTLQLRRSVLS